VRGPRSKLIQKVDFASTDEEGSDTNSDVSEFRREHQIDQIFEPSLTKNKLVISVIDSGIGIKKNN